MNIELIKLNMTEKEKTLWSSYAKEVCLCTEIGSTEGVMYWARYIDEIFKRVEDRIQSSTPTTIKGEN